MFLKITAQAFEAGDFLNIFLKFGGFRSSFSYKKSSYKKNMYSFFNVDNYRKNTVYNKKSKKPIE